MMIRSKDFHDAGAFDDSFFAHMEEIDLCWRLNSLKRKNRVIPASCVYHVGGGTLSYQSPFKTYLNFRNGLKLLIKNLPFRKLLIKLPVRILLDWVASILFILQGNLKHAISVWKAHVYLVKNFRSIYKKRGVVSSIDNGKSILYDFFIAGKKTYLP